MCYISHCAVSTKKSEVVSKEAIKVLEESNSVSSIKILATDGEPANTGHLAGNIRRVENYLCRPLTWVVCLLHQNELFFKEYFRYCDHEGSEEKNKSPKSSGPEDHVQDFGTKFLDILRESESNSQLEQSRLI